MDQSIRLKDTGTSTPQSIDYVRLGVLKGMVKLESKGMQTRGGAIRPRIAAEFGLKPRASYADFIATIQKKMDKIVRAKEQA
jgi:hypothetical protein